MDLSSIPKDACPLCRQVALDRTGTLWQCRSCGCRLEFDPRTRRSRIVYFPDEYAVFEGTVGSAWLTRREMFERVEAAQRAQAAAERSGSGRWFGPILIVALTLTVACVILAAIATALVISPSLARTRRAISAAYQPTPTPTPTVGPAVVTTMPLPAVGTLDSPIQPQPTPTAETDQDEPLLPTPTPQTVMPEPAQQPTAPPPLPTPASVLDSPLPKPEVTLPPTFTPSAPQPTVAAASPGTPEVPATPTSPAVLPTDTPAATAPPPPPTSPPPPPATPTPVTLGSVIFQGTVRIRAIQPAGSGPNQADEYVELYNEGSQQVNLNGWSLKAIRTADNTIIDTYLFGNGAVIAAGQVCRIYTNVLFAPDDCGFSGGFASEEPIWPDNGGARASLFNQGNIEYARFTY